MWKFKELETGEIEESLSWQDILFREHKDAESLVREVIQNSLDARENSFIQVNFIIGKNLPRKFALICRMN